jgi:hypothetical protein
MTGGAASSVREGGSASGCARTGRVIGLCVLLGRASAARLREWAWMTARDWAARCWAEPEEKEKSARAVVLFFFLKNMNSVNFCLFQ